MTVEIDNPEIEAIIEQRMSTGEYPRVQDMLFDALKGTLSESSGPRLQVWLDSLAEIRALGGVELDIARDRTDQPPVDLS